MDVEYFIPYFRVCVDDVSVTLDSALLTNTFRPPYARRRYRLLLDADSRLTSQL